MAGVQRKVWMIWNQMIRSDRLTRPVTVEFTILADGSTQDVRLVEASGVYLADRAAQSAVLAAAPFAPLPKDRGSRITYRATFKPV
jgi:TonB family protein